MYRVIVLTSHPNSHTPADMIALYRRRAMSWSSTHSHSSAFVRGPRRGCGMAIDICRHGVMAGLRGLVVHLVLIVPSRAQQATPLRPESPRPVFGSAGLPSMRPPAWLASPLAVRSRWPGRGMRVGRQSWLRHPAALAEVAAGPCRVMTFSPQRTKIRPTPITPTSAPANITRPLCDLLSANAASP